jgi:hypothetical protein
MRRFLGCPARLLTNRQRCPAQESCSTAGSGQRRQLSLFTGMSVFAGIRPERQEETTAKKQALEQIKVSDPGGKDLPQTEPATWARLGVGSSLILIVLLSLLIGTGVIIYRGWTLEDSPDVPGFGYAAMAFGVIISLTVGFGLMALVFYSSRQGYDEPPVLIVSEDDSEESKNTSEPK